MAVVKGKGTTLKNGTNLIGQIFDIQLPNPQNPELDTTDLDDAERSFTPTIIDYGEFSFKLNYDSADTQHAALWTAKQAGTSVSWTITLSDTGTTTIAFSGHIKQWQWGNATVNNKIELTVTVKLTGAITLTP